VAVKIRLKRMGKIRAPFYRVVVMDSRAKRDGRAIEEIGKYHPTEEPSVIHINSDRAQYWLGQGAQPTEAVAALIKIVDEGKLQTKEPKTPKKRAAKKADETPKADETKADDTKADVAPKAEEPKADEPKADEPKAEATEAVAEAPVADEAKAETEEAPAAAEADAADKA